jgi:hypothetical protein
MMNPRIGSAIAAALLLAPAVAYGTSPYKQDYLSVAYGSALRTVPEPGTLTLLCIAVLSAWGTAMRRQQTA